MHAAKTMRPVNLLAIVLALLAPAPASAQTEWPIDGVAPGGVSYASSNAYPKGDYYTHLQSASGDAPNACDWGWGCGGSPYRTGPGQCDTWRVGPVWRGSLEGLVMYRDKTDIVALAGAADAGGVALPLNADAVTSNFEHGAGVRLSVTGNYPQCRGYEMNVTYLGIFKWDAGAFNPEVPQAGPIGPQPDLIVQRSLSYRSSLHSLAFNGQTTGDDRVKLFGGMRYVRLSEDIDDLYDEESPTPSLAPVLVDDLELTDILRNVAVDNNLIGFQGGVRSDLLSLGERFYISGFANAGRLLQPDPAFDDLRADRHIQPGRRQRDRHGH